MNNLDIVIVNWNSGSQLKSCCDSIALAADSVDLGVVAIVDNASNDNALSLVSESTLPLEIIRNNRNRGFAAACNQGASNGKSEFLLFLNPDVQLENGSLSSAVDFIKSPDAAEYAMCGIQLYGQDGSIQKTCTRFPSSLMLFSNGLGLDRLLPRIFPSHFMQEWNHGESRDVDHVIGAFYLVRRSVFLDLGGFDERFFVYLEDLDLSLRIAKAGWKCRYMTNAKAFHKGGGTSENILGRRLFYSVRSRVLFGFKHFGKPAGITLLLFAIVMEPVIRVVYQVVRGEIKDVKATVEGYWLLAMHMPEILKNGFCL